MERQTVGTDTAAGIKTGVIPPPPAGFDLTEPPKLAKSIPPPPAGFDLTTPPPADPLARKITRPEDLPSQQEFDASHQAASNAITQALTPAPQFQRPASSQGMGGAPPKTDHVKNLIDTIKGIASTPGIPLSKLAPEHPTSAVGGAFKGAMDTAEGLTTPTNIALMVGAGPLAKVLGKVAPLLPKVLSAGFSVQMLSDLVHQVPEVADAVKGGDPAKIAESVTKAAATAGFAALSTKHTFAGEPKPSSADMLDRVKSGDRDTRSATSAELVKRIREGDTVQPEVTVEEKPGRTSRAELAATARKPAAAKRTTAEMLRDMKSRVPPPPEGFDLTEPPAPKRSAEELASIARRPDTRGSTANNAKLAAEVRAMKGKEGEQTSSDEGGKREVNPKSTAQVTETVTPKTLYRGVPKGAESRPTVGGGRFYSGDRKVAEAYAGKDGTVEEADHDFKNLLETSKWTDAKDKLGLKESATMADLIDFARKAGHDGISFTTKNGKEFIKIEPETRQEEPVAAEAPTPQTKPESPKSEAPPVKTVPSGREPATPPVVGREVSVAVPGEETQYPARYVVREMADVHPSHNGLNFEPNPTYEVKNDRDYKSNSHLQAAVVDRAGEKFNPDFTTSDNPTAEHGPSIIDPRGNVLGGNSRVQTMQRVDEFNPAGREKYNEALKAKASAFGVDAEAVANMKRPVLLRELTGQHDSQRAVTDFNKGAPAKLSPAEQAVSDGRRLSSKTVQDIAARMGDLGESGTMAEALRGDSGAEVLNHLERDGVITAQEKGGHVDARDHLTPEIKARISKALVGRLFSNPEEFKNTPPAMHGKLERIAPQVLRVEGRPEWDLTEHVRDAVSLVEEARAHKSKVADTAAQTGIGERKVYGPEAVRIAEVMEENPRNVEHAFRRYANDEALSREGAQSSMFEPPTRAQAFADAFGDLPPQESTSHEKPMEGLEQKIAGIRKAAIEQVKAKKKGGAASFAYKAAKKLASDESGAVTLPDIKKIKDAYDKSDIKAYVGATARVGRSLGARVAMEGGGTGRVLMRMIEKADDYGTREAGRLLVRIADARPSRLKPAQRFDVLDAMEGRLKPSKLDTEARQAFDAYKEGDTEIGLQATALGMEMQTKNGKRPFVMMQDHFPHVLRPAADLKSGRIREDVIENIVRQKIQPDKASATAFVDDWVKFLESGARKQSLIEHVAKAEGIPEAEALARLEKYRTNIAKHGSLEYARELNLPFYDPDPVRVMPFVLASGAKRLAQVATFGGQDHKLINQEILNISRAGGDTDFVRKSVDRMIGKNIDKTDDAVFLRFVRSLSSLKMSTSFIRNATQPINAIVAGDLPSFMAGARDAFTEQGKRNAIESGATIDPVLDEATAEAGGGAFMRNYLRPFTATERFNRALSANAGMQWAKRNIEWAKGTGAKADGAKAVLRDLGIDANEAVKNGLTDDDLFMAAKKFSDLTQFRTRPQDLPNFATESPWGKAWFQFKGFAYQQARFAADQTYGEFKDGRPERGVRNLLLLGVAFPYTVGELMRVVQNGITGRDEKFKSGLNRYFDNLAQSSSAGIMLDAVQAVGQGRIPEFIGGPAVGQAKDLGKMFADLADDNKTVEQKKKAVEKYALSRFGSAPQRAVQKLK